MIFFRTIANRFSALALTVPLILFSGTAFGGWDFAGSVSAEARVFLNDPAYPEQNDATLSPSIAVEPEFVYEWNHAHDRLTFIPFARLDADDDNRSHFDLREANWLHIGEGWDFVAGVSKVFWGVTESRHLVDIINQTDAVENIDGEDKLGQPMINFNLIRDWGTLGVFVLPGFRERTFADDDARLRGPLAIDVDNARYESSRKERHIDAALRWRHTVGDWDIGLAHFVGTSREPRLIQTISNGRIVFIPYYDLIDQTSLDLQLTAEAMLWKFEAITRGGQGRRFAAAVAGLEYTLYGIVGSAADLGFLFEYLYDDRDITAAPPTFADDDVFLGARLALNNAQDTTFLAGVIIDRHSQESLLSIETEHRINNNWKFEVEGRFFLNVPDNSLNAGFRDDDHLTLRISRYF